jgi:hypothetical protein
MILYLKKSLTSVEEHWLIKFENWVLIKIYGPKEGLITKHQSGVKIKENEWKKACGMYEG